MKRLINLVSCLALAVTSFINCFSQGIVCRKERIDGFDEQYNQAKSAINTYTSVSDIEASEIYMTYKDDNIYLHSNFKNPGAPYSTKLASSENSTIENLAYNIYFTGEASPSEYEYFLASLRNNVNLTVDVRLLNHPHFSNLDFSSIKNLSFAFPPGHKREAFRLVNNTGELEYLLKYNDRIFTRINNQNLNFIFSALENKQIKSGNIKVLSLIESRATKNLVDKELINEKLDFNYTSTDDLKKLILKNKGTRTIVLGHVEGADFVTRNAGGKLLFKVSLSELETFQQQNGLELILVGCNSGLSGGSGALNKFNSIDAVNRIKTARETKTVGEFIDSLSSGVFRFVVDQTFFTAIQGDAIRYENYALEMPAKVKIDVFEKNGAGLPKYNSRQLGTIIILGLATSELASPDIVPGPSEPYTPSGSDTGTSDRPVIQGIDSTDGDQSGLTLRYIALGLIFLGVLLYLIFKK